MSLRRRPTPQRIVVLDETTARAVAELCALDGVDAAAVVGRAVYVYGAAKTMQWTEAESLRAAMRPGVDPHE